MCLLAECHAVYQPAICCRLTGPACGTYFAENPWPQAEWQSAPATFDMFTDRGPGVVGETPVLHPGQKHEYHSAVPLNTSTGSMYGTFRMVTMSQDDKHIGDEFDIEVAQFSLDVRAGSHC